MSKGVDFCPIGRLMGAVYDPSTHPFPLTRKTVGYSAFNPVTILLNVVVSFAVRWQVGSRLHAHARVVYHDPSIGRPKPTPICPSPSNGTNTQTKQLAAEQALRDSGVDYTVIRPGALVDCAATPDDLVRIPVRFGGVCGLMADPGTFQSHTPKNTTPPFTHIHTRRWWPATGRASPSEKSAGRTWRRCAWRPSSRPKPATPPSPASPPPRRSRRRRAPQ